VICLNVGGVLGGTQGKVKQSRGGNGEYQIDVRHRYQHHALRFLDTS
jgi:hypothetical protein